MSNVFDLPGVDETDIKLKITEGGRKDATKGQPPHDQREAAGFELNISGHMVGNVIDDTRKGAQSILTKQHKERASLKIDEALSKILHSSADLLADLDTLDSTKSTRMIPLWVNHFTNEGNFRYFREENRLTREPSYPRSKIFHWSIIAIIVLIETVLNAIFLQQGSELGFVGGLISALIITAVNVLVAMIVGTYVVPWLFHINIFIKILGGLLVLGYLWLLANFCLLVGHYRSELDKDPYVAAERAVTSFIDNMWGIDNFNGWILVGVSFSVGIFATIKFFIADDKYPGYGNIHRRNVAAQEAVDEAKVDFEESYVKCVDASIAAVHANREKADSYVSQYKLLLNESEQIIKSYAKYISSAEKFYEILVERYRSANKKVRSIEAPAYFSEKPKLDADSVPQLDTFQLEEDKARLQGIEDNNVGTPELTSESIKAIQQIKTDGAERRINILQRVSSEATDLYGNQRVN